MLTRSMPAALALALAAASAAQDLQPPASRVQMPLFDTFTEFDTGSVLVQRMPIMAAYGDVDGDRKVDAVIASAEWYQPKLTVLKNAGNLKFNNRKMYATAKPSGGVVLIDMDRDGDLDAVLAEPDQYGSGTTIGVYRNNGSGAFGSRTAFPAGAGPVSPIAADFDQDGNMDVAVANYGGFGSGTTASVLFGNGAGGFSAPLSILVGEGAQQVVAADFNGDGRPDLAVARAAHGGSQTALAVSFNQGGRTFSSAIVMDAAPPENWAGNGYACVAAGDLDRDGDVDLAFSSNFMYDGTTGGFLVYSNAGNGIFGPKQFISWQIPYAQGVVGLAIADFDRDGWQDVAGTQFTDVQSNCFFVVRRGQNGVYRPAEMYAAGTGSQSLVVRDFNSDSQPDIAIVNYYSYTLSLHLNRDGRFPEAEKYDSIPLGFSLELGDVDGDGFPDAATASGYGSVGVIAWQRNDGQGRFGEPFEIVESLPAAGPKLRDLDGDGDLDFMFHDGTAGNGVPLQIRWHANDGSGNFGPSRQITVNMAHISMTATADLNKDSKLDILAVDDFRNEVKVLMGLGNGEFGPYKIVPAPNGAAGLLTADFNKDGKLDLAVICSQPYGYAHQMGISMGNGDGTFGPFQAYNTDDGPSSFDAGDINGDGNLDLVLANNGFENDATPSYSVFLGKGDGTFQPERRFTDSAVLNPGALKLQDLNGDRRLDMVLVNYKANSVGLYVGRGDGTFEPQVHYGVGFAPTAMALLDIDGDNTLDLITKTVPSNVPLTTTYVTVLRGKRPSLASRP